MTVIIPRPLPTVPPGTSISNSWAGPRRAALADLACDTSSGGGSASCTTLLLLSVQGGATVWNGTPVPNSGEFDTSSSPNPGGFNNSGLGYVYQVPGNTTSGSAYFQLRAWSGDFTSFTDDTLDAPVVK